MSTRLDNLENCANHLINGKIVSFPTETVYGLGGNAFNENAIKKIYMVKERPTTDPLIVHIDKFERLLEWDLVDLTKDQLDIVKRFSDKYWPGPLTLILKSSKKIPDLVTASSGLIGIRIPNNKLALSLIEKANLPIAAPSANKFGHISPTMVSHVESNFKNQQLIKEPVYILENKSNCDIGIESTIIEFNKNFSEISILRLGYITDSSLSEIFNGKINYKPEYKKDNDELKSPGQHVKHYATSCDTYLLRINSKQSLANIKSGKNVGIIDIGNENKFSKNEFGYYDNISYNENIEEAIQSYYKKLYIFEEKKINLL